MNDGVFVHERALVEPGARIGAGTRVWAWAHILGGAVIGRGCNICDQTFIENEVVIGDRVTIKCGVQVWDGVRLDDDVFVGPNVTFTNDLFPRSKQRPERFAPTHIRQGASLGANSTILAGVVVGQYAMVGAGAVVTNNVPPHATVVGNPAVITGYVGKNGERGPHKTDTEKIQDLNVRGAHILDFPLVRDLRGDLTFAEIHKPLPFVPQRVFTIFNVPTRKVRGEHAHRTLQQVLICITGSVSVMVDNGYERGTVVLDAPVKALHISPMIWTAQFNYSPDARLIVLASDVYKTDDYIRDYDRFLAEVRTRG